MFAKLFERKASFKVKETAFNLEFEVSRGRTVLESALGSGIAFPHQCKVGTCGTCRYRLDDGKIAELQSSATSLNREQLAAGWRLACQSIPKSDLTICLPAETALAVAGVEKFRGKIAALDVLTHDIFQVTVELDRPMRFEPGQYAELTTESGIGPRSYSFSSPADPAGTTRPTFFVRKVLGGSFTEWLFAANRVGEAIDLNGPFGSFRLVDAPDPLVCIGGGSGLAPLKCILENGLRNGCERPVTLLFGGRTQADLLCLEEIDAIRRSWRSDFTFIPVLSMEPVDSDWTGRRGMVTAHLQDVTGVGNSHAYLCGPPAMVDAAESALLALGLRNEVIYADRFYDRTRA